MVEIKKNVEDKKLGEKPSPLFNEFLSFLKAFGEHILLLKAVLCCSVHY